MNIEAMRQLQRVMREVPEGHFDITGVTCGAPNIPESKDDVRLLLHTCGTTACAMGWAAADGWFRERGMILRNHFEFDQERAQEIFDLDWSQFHEIFLWDHASFSDIPDHDITPQHVIEAVEQMIQAHLDGGHKP